MSQERKNGVTEDREMIEANVRRIVGIAVLIWTYGSPRAEPMIEPLPQCSPLPGGRISI
jgi:hypothetical protein